MARVKSSTRGVTVALASMAVCVSGVALLLATKAPVYDYTWLEAPLSFLFSGVALAFLVRLAAFPPRTGMRFERRAAFSVAAGCAIATQLVQWCPWAPVHENRGWLMLAMLILTPITLQALESRARAPVSPALQPAERDLR
jgi:hypothetical protein